MVLAGGTTSFSFLNAYVRCLKFKVTFVGGLSLSGIFVRKNVEVEFKKGMLFAVEKEWVHGLLRTIHLVKKPQNQQI